MGDVIKLINYAHSDWLRVSVRDLSVERDIILMYSNVGLKILMLVATFHSLKILKCRLNVTN